MGHLHWLAEHLEEARHQHAGHRVGVELAHARHQDCPGHAAEEAGHVGVNALRLGPQLHAINIAANPNIAAANKYHARDVRRRAATNP
jgi:hypothetical protein